ncbi:MAG: alkaline phosphatase [Nitrospirales bacterium]|nr:alkaline phosphatase [Nitrospira sp.]MDR4461538.1 alkaline phosphatase [Nitrospirales bacterium]MDR4481801.1 alkaline phosphatase [Nitrospirales bacterium]
MSTSPIRSHQHSHSKFMRCFFLAWTVVWLLLIGGTASIASPRQAEHIILVVLEGIKSSSIQNGATPNLARLAKDGAVTWTAQSITPPLTVPAMASLLTGLQVEKHRVTADWETYDFARSFMRSPTVFDYMDLAGGKDTGVFLMDERLYQLVRPEIYVDSQVCGYTKPQCTPERASVYIKDFLKKVTSEKGYGFRLFGVPNLLLVHLPTAVKVGQKYGWDSEKYSAALLSIDTAVEQIIQSYKELGVLDQTMVIITGLNSGPLSTTTEGAKPVSTSPTAPKLDSTIPWIAWGANIKSNHPITQSVSLLDTGATIMYALGLETYTEWDSHAIGDIFQTVPERRTTDNEPQKKQ